MNALTDPFIDCLYDNGKFAVVSAQTALQDSRRIMALTFPPIDNFAVLRFLLVLNGWKSQKFDPDGAKLRLRGEERKFDLFSSRSRFMQIDRNATGRDVNNDAPMGFLLREIPTGTSPNLYGIKKAYDDDDYGLCPACCLKGILRLPPYAVGEGRYVEMGETWFHVQGAPGAREASVNGQTPQYVYPVGKTLYETLKLNYMTPTPFDTPEWDHKPHDGVTGYLEAFTWQPRALYLHDSESKSICHYCGTMAKLVRRCYYSAIVSRKPNKWVDPHVLLNEDGDKVYAPNPFSRWYAKSREALLKHLQNVPERFVTNVVECVAFATGQGVKARKTFYEDFCRVCKQESGELVVESESESQPVSYTQSPTVDRSVFIDRLSKLTLPQQHAMSVPGSQEESDVFNSVWRGSTHGSKRIVWLILRSYCRYPVFGGYRINVRKLLGRIDIDSMMCDRVLESKVGWCKSHHRPINWRALLQDLYALS